MQRCLSSYVYIKIMSKNTCLLYEFVSKKIKCYLLKVSSKFLIILALIPYHVVFKMIYNMSKEYQQNFLL